MSADGELVIMHNFTVDEDNGWKRQNQGYDTEGNPFPWMREAWFDKKFRGERVPLYLKNFGSGKRISQYVLRF